MKYFLMILVTLSSAFANEFEPYEANASEILHAIYECNKEFVQVNYGADARYFSAKKNEPEKDGDKSTFKKVFTITTTVGGWTGGAPAQPIGTLTITQTVTMSAKPKPVPEPATVATKCKIEKPKG